MPGGMSGFVIYQTMTNVTGKIAFIRLYPSQSTLSGVYFTPLPANTVMYQVVLYFNVIEVGEGQDAGNVQAIKIIDGLCTDNGKPSAIIMTLKLVIMFTFATNLNKPQPSPFCSSSNRIACHCPKFARRVRSQAENTPKTKLGTMLALVGLNALSNIRIGKWVEQQYFGGATPQIVLKQL